MVPVQIVQSLHDQGVLEVPLHEFTRGELPRIELGVPPELRVVVRLVKDDLPGQLVDRQGIETRERHGEGNDVAGLDRLIDRCGARQRTELRYEFRDRFRAPQIAEHNAVAGLDSQPSDGAANQTRANDSDGGCHLGYLLE